MLHYQTIDTKTLALLKSLMKIPEFSQLVLVGGTSLALQIGHRKSIDIDLFGKFTFDEYQLPTLLKQYGSVIQLNNSVNIKSYLIDNIKVDFVHYPYEWIESFCLEDGLRLAGMKDIAAMKLAAVTGRGTKKDFIDIFFLLSYFSLVQMLDFYLKKFFDGSAFMVIKSLTYFKDAEAEELPVLIEDINWEEVKSRIILETKKIVNPG